MSTLAILLPSPTDASATEYRCVWWQGTDARLHAKTLTLAQLTTMGDKRREVVAIIPVQRISWHLISLPRPVAATITAPRAQPNHVRAVLTGAMEEQLLDAPQDLHFAVFPSAQAAPTGQAQMWVAVCDAGWLHAQADALERAGLSPNRLVAEAEPAETTEAAYLTVDASLEPAAMVVRNARGVLRLPLLPHGMRMANDLPTRQSAEPAVLALAEQTLGPQVQAGSRNAWLQDAALTGRDLAQGAFGTSRRSRLTKRLRQTWASARHAPAWRPARWAVLAIAVVNIVAINAVAWRESHQLAAQRAEQQAVLLRTFPETTVVVDAPLQMRRAVERLAQSRGAATSLHVGQILTTVAQSAPGAQQVSAIELANGSLRLQGLRWSEAEWASVAQALESLGYQVRRDASMLHVSQGAHR